MNAHRYLLILVLTFVNLCHTTLARQDSDNKQAITDFDTSQVLDEIAEHVERNFFDNNFDVAGWKEKVAKARPKAIAAKSRDEFSNVINELLKALNTSHTKYFSKLDPRRYQLLGVFHQLYPADQKDLFIYEGVGIYTMQRDGKTYVSSVFDGLPAHKAGLKFGDQIHDVDGKPFHPILSFRGKAGTATKIQIRRGEKNVTLDVKAERLDGRTMFETALKESITVYATNGKQIGYIHAWSYAGAKYQEAIRSAILWGDLSQCDALILDVRDGWGGADLSYLNLFRKPILEIESRPRSGPPRNYTGVWGKPVALLTNGGSTSGKELFTFGFKKLKLGEVFGEKTAGAVVAGRCFLLSNKDVLYVAVHDLKVDGVRLEGRGVKPDFHIERSITEPAKIDPQLIKAIEYLGGHPPRR